uniref:Uncharacterized protein n=1 Tax=Salix viminalis TaxID=40686 RepID=A0A6N2ME48_SALVM
MADQVQSKLLDWPKSYPIDGHDVVTDWLNRFLNHADMSRVDSISGEVFFRGVTAVEHVSEGNRVRLLEGGEEGPEFVVVGRESEGKWFGEKTLMSIRSPNQSMHPLPPFLMSKFEYAVQLHFSKHLFLHSLRFIVLLNHVDFVSGIFTPASFRNPSPEQFNGVFLTQPFDQSVMSQSAGDFGTNPFKQPHTGEL